MHPDVTICMPVFNGVKFISASLETVVRQTYKFIKILIVDDGSTDGTVEVIKRFALKDSRIILVQNEINLGLVENWNKCLKLVDTKWVKFHFQDDLLDLECIEKMVLVAKSNNLQVVLANRSYFGDLDNELVRKQIKSINKNLKTLAHYFPKDAILEPVDIVHVLRLNFLKHNFLGEPIVGLFHLDIIKKYGHFNTSLKQWVDFEFWLRICTNVNVGFIFQTLHKFRIHNQSQSAKNRMEEVVLNKTVRDLVSISTLLRSSGHYNYLREELIKIGDNELDVLIGNRLRHLAITNGYDNFLTSYGEEFMSYIPWTKKDALLSRVYQFMQRLSKSK